MCDGPDTGCQSWNDRLDEEPPSVHHAHWEPPEDAMWAHEMSDEPEQPDDSCPFCDAPKGQPHYSSCSELEDQLD